MSAILSYLSYFLPPIGCSLEAFAQTHLTISSSTGQDVTKWPGREIKAEMQPFLDKMGIRKDLIVIEKDNHGIGMTLGTNDYTGGDAAILIAPKLYETDKEACRWLMKHEISHLKNNDNFKERLVVAIATTAAAIFGFYKFGTVPALLMTIPIGQVVDDVLSNYCERRADNFAVAESSIEELKGGRRFFIAVQQALSEQRTSLLSWLAISPEGDSRFIFSCPSGSSRIRKIEDELKRRNVAVNDAEENERIQRLKILLSTIVQKYLGKITNEPQLDVGKSEETAYQHLCLSFEAFDISREQSSFVKMT